MASAFQSSAFQQNAFQSSANQNVAVTGVSATGAVGSVTVSGKANVPVTGVFATGSVGSVVVTGRANVPVTGVSATGQTGSVSLATNANISVTGVSATGATGTVVVTGRANVPVTGVSATSQLGSVSISDNEIVPVTGVSATGATGTVVVTGKANVSVTGVSATGQTGSVTVSSSAVISLTGVTATGETGSVVVSVAVFVPVIGVASTGFVSSVSVFGTAIVAPTGPPAYGYVGSVTVAGNAVVQVTGLSATSSLGTVSVTGTASVSLSGVTATGSVGSVTVAATANVLVTGVSATGQTGTVTVSGNAVVLLTGVTATASLGTVTVTGTAVVSLTGVSATAELGNVSTTANGNVSINVSGVTGTGAAGTVTVSTDANFSVTGVSGTTQLGSVTVIEGVGVTVLVSGVSATGQLGTVIVSVPVLVTGVTATGFVGTVTVFAQANIVVLVTGVEATGFIGTVEANPALYVPVTGVFATGYIGQMSSWITVDDFQECDWGDIPEGAPSDWVPIEPCINDTPWVNPIETVQFVPAAIPNWEQPSNSEDSEMHSWVPVPIGASNSWTTISPCDPRVDMDIALAGVFATGEVGFVTSGSILIVPLTNTNLLTTGQIGNVTVPTGVTGVQASGLLGSVEVDVVSVELVSLLRAWSEYGGAPIGFPNYQDAAVFDGSQAPLVAPLNVWGSYFGVYPSSAQTKNTEYSLLYYFDGYGEYGGQLVYEYPYNPPESDFVVYFNPITGDYTQELWVYLNGPSPAPEGFKYSIISGNGDGSNYPLISGYELFVNDTSELVFSIWIDAADYFSPTYTISGGTVPFDEWVHLAVSRSSNVIRVFINGVSIGTITYSGPIPNTPTSLSVSSLITQIVGTEASIYTDSFRWINELALYTSNFTPPAYLSPYFSDVVGLYMVGSVGDVFVPVPTLLSLVTPWSGGLGSTSSYPNFTVAKATDTVSNVGTASDVFDAAQAPMVNPDWLWFGEYVSETFTYYNTTIKKNYNYSVEFPGLYGEYIQTNASPRISSPTASGIFSNFTQKFTCEAWVYVSYATPPTVAISFIVLHDLSDVYNVTLMSTSDRKLQLRIFEGDPVYDYVVDISGGTIPYNSWTHLALNVDGPSIKIFINGVEVASASYDWYIPNTTYQIVLLNSIGYSSPATKVYLDSFRLIGAGSLYSSNFTPPAYFSPYFSDVVGLYMVTSVGTVTVPEP